MNSVQLPPGIIKESTASTVGVPWGAGRPIRPSESEHVGAAQAEIRREQRPGPGRPTIFRTPEELDHACEEYFQWVDTHPLKEQKVQFSNTRGAWATTHVDKKRPYTQGALCLYLGITQMTWGEWAKPENKFREIVIAANQRCREQKFEGAASGFFNANIIARDLGLADKQEVTGAGGGPIEKITSEMSAEEAAERYAKTREG